MKEFQIWIEGYRATGESGTAHTIGSGIGENFDEAVKDYMEKNPNNGICKNERNMYHSDESYNNRRSNWNIWRCNLFENESDARKIFG